MTNSHPLAAEAEQVLQGVTEGPWGFIPAGNRPDVCQKGKWVDGYICAVESQNFAADAAFIAFARAWVPEAAATLTALSAEAAALKAKVAELTRERDEARTWLGAANNEFGSAAWNWPDLWRRIAQLKELANERWQRAEAAEAKVARLEGPPTANNLYVRDRIVTALRMIANGGVNSKAFGEALADLRKFATELEPSDPAAELIQNVEDAARDAGTEARTWRRLPRQSFKPFEHAGRV